MLLHRLLHKKISVEHQNIDTNIIYENNIDLLEAYGKCKAISTHLTMLLIADLHGCLSWKERKIELEQDYDVCFLLGDLSYYDVDMITNTVNTPIYGIYGNHDEKGYFEHFNITNIHNKIITVNNISFIGFEGSPRYKQNMIGYTQDEYSELCRIAPAADIVLSHASPYNPDINDSVHCGFKGISNYIYKNRIPYCFYGHNHNSQKSVMPNGCQCECIYGIKKITI